MAEYVKKREILRIKQFLAEKQGYKKWGSKRLAKLLNVPLELVLKARGSETSISVKVKEEAALKQPKSNFKRLFFDIETSYNVVSVWNIGREISISHDNLLKERAVICVSYKWADDPKVYSLVWKNGEDKQLIKNFIKVLDQASEIIGHNSDKYDLRFLRARAIKHNLAMAPKYTTIDTLKLARRGFSFNSNRLDYLGKFFGVGGKMDTGGFKLWQKIIMDNDKSALAKMVRYCNRDVLVLEKIYNRLNKYTEAKTHAGVLQGKSRCSCPNCASDNLIVKATKITVSGLKNKQLQCQNCGKYHSVSETTWLNKDKQ